MKRLLLKATFASFFLQLWGCGLRPPSSLQIGHYNTATGLPLYASERVSYEQVNATLLPQNITLPNPAAFPDDKVIKFSAGLKRCRDTFRLPDLSNLHLPTAPGTRLITPQGLAIDEAETTNLDWRLFVSDVFPADSSSADVLATVI